MNGKQRKILEPFAEVLEQWDQKIIDMTPEARAELRAACEAVTETNVCCSIYDVAHLLLPYIRDRDMIVEKLENEQDTQK